MDEIQVRRLGHLFTRGLPHHRSSLFFSAQFIVARLNDPPFRKRLSLVDFDDKSPGERTTRPPFAARPRDPKEKTRRRYI